jgi:hypothetical protein
MRASATLSVSAHERSLDLTNVVQPVVDDLVVACRGMSADGGPQLGIRPELMPQEITKQWIHPSHSSMALIERPAALDPREPLC